MGSICEYRFHMKSAYELAMERLSRQAPTHTLSAEQKERIAELESIYRARIAGRELATRDEVLRWTSSGEPEKAALAQSEFAAEKQSLEAELEEKKERVRSGKLD